MKLVPPSGAGTGAKESLEAGKTQYQAQSFAAFGYFRPSASGKGTPEELGVLKDRRFRRGPPMGRDPPRTKRWIDRDRLSGKEGQQVGKSLIGMGHRPRLLLGMPPAADDGLELRHPLRGIRQAHDEPACLPRPATDQRTRLPCFRKRAPASATPYPTPSYRPARNRLLRLQVRPPTHTCGPYAPQGAHASRGWALVGLPCLDCG